jgi:hypothetical protein
MCKRNFIYDHEKSAAFPVAIFVKLTNAQQHNTQISDTRFQPNQTINVESTKINLCP